MKRKLQNHYIRSDISPNYYEDGFSLQYFVHIAYTTQEMIHISSIACFQILLFVYILLYY